MSGAPAESLCTPSSSRQLSIGIASLVVESAFYSVYAILFGTCVCILYKRRQKPSFVRFLITAVVMFGLSTGHIFYVFYAFFANLQDSLSTPIHIDGAGPIDYLLGRIFSDPHLGLMYFINNMAADGLIVYRCYVVWGFKKSVIIVPVLLVIATGVSGCILPSAPSPAMMILSLITNVLVTALIGGHTGVSEPMAAINTT